MKIKFHERFQPLNQLKILEDALYSDGLASEGKYVRILSDYLKNEHDIDNILLTTSATTALELGLQLLDLKEGDEVILPSFNFPSAANAVLRSGGIPVLCDVETKTKNLCLEDAAARITKKTKAIIPAHYAGIACDMDRLIRLARDHDLRIIEDAAQGVNSYYDNRPLGTLGTFGAYSFHHTKNFSAGEGGIFLCNERSYLEKAEIFRENGTDKAKFSRGEVACYSWKSVGSNFVLGETATALIYSQMMEHCQITTKRKMVAEEYTERFQDSGVLGEKLTLMEIPKYMKENHHIYYINCPNEKFREALRLNLLEDGIDARTHFVPLHASKLGKELWYEDMDLPNSMKTSQRILRLPIHTQLSREDVEFVASRLIQRVREL